jgi:hypothetical protein
MLSKILAGLITVYLCSFAFMQSESFMGEWIAFNGTIGGQVIEIRAVFNPDGIYTWDLSHPSNGASSSEKGNWTFENNRIILQPLESSTDNPLTAETYLYEQVSDNSFRMSGGNFGLVSLLFEKSDGQENNTAWLLGDWGAVVGSSQIGLRFFEDGSYEQASLGASGSEESFQGTWSLEGNTLTLSSADTTTYAVSTGSDGMWMEWEKDGNTVFLQRPDGYARPNVSGNASLAGQYVSEDTTLVITENGDDYKGSLLYLGQQVPVEVLLENTQTTLTYTLEGQTQTLVAAVENNALRVSSTGIDILWRKQSETPLPQPEGLIGEWILDYDSVNASSSLTFLPDGHYLYQTSLDGYTTNERGTYEVAGSQMNFLPLCGEPYSREVQQVNNHLITSEGGSLKAFIFEPISNETVVLGNEQVQAEAQAWLEQIVLAPATADAVQPGGNIPVDPNPATILADAQTFAEQELYFVRSSYWYTFDDSGAFIQRNIASSSVDGNETLDSGQEQYFDKTEFYFFPNSRAFLRFELYANADLTTSPPTPLIQGSWGRYTIQDDTLSFKSDEGEQLELSLLEARRLLNWDSECYENTKWTEARLE